MDEKVIVCEMVQIWNLGNQDTRFLFVTEVFWLYFISTVTINIILHICNLLKGKGKMNSCKTFADNLEVLDWA
jgi:hypothetical protein